MNDNYETEDTSARDVVLRRNDMNAEIGKRGLFRVTMKAYKVFYVMAESQDDALTHPAIEDEERPNSRGDFNWEHDETDAARTSKDEEEFTTKRHPELIAKDE